MKNIVEEQLKECYNKNNHFIRYVFNHGKLFVVFYNFDNENNEVIYETRGEIEINRIKQFI